ncbi:MAG: VTC domain-containing protein [Myxococcota bacterium]
MTADREETKYLVPGASIDGIIKAVSRHLTLHRFTGEGANRLPDPHHFVTTIYFDTPSRRHYHAAVCSMTQNVKIRAKEYYDLHPSLAELATDPAQIVKYQPWVWFEIKRRNGSQTTKRRFRLPKRDMPRVLQAHRLSAEALLDTERETATAGLSELAEYVQSLGEPLSANTLVNYRRLSWQNPDSTLRVTLDLGLSFHAPPSDLWNRDQALVPTAFGAARHAFGAAVLEVKRRAALPDWLERSLKEAELAPESFSKFVAGSRAVHGGS